MPMTKTLGTKYPNGSVRHPKYLLGIKKWDAVDFGLEDVCICVLRDASEEVRQIIESKPDVLTLPDNLEVFVSEEHKVKAQAFLSTKNTPNHWIDTGRSYRKALRLGIGSFELNRAYLGKFGHSVFHETALEAKYSELSLLEQLRMGSCLRALDVEDSFITEDITVSQIFYEFGKRYIDRGIKLGGIVI